MKNPISDTRVYQVQDGGAKHLIVIGYSRSGIVRAFKGYSDIVLATARGGGYDKMATALDMAVEKLTGETVGVNGASGINAVIDAWSIAGVRIIDVLDAAITL